MTEQQKNNEEYKNQLINDLNLKSLNNAERTKILNEIKNFNFDVINNDNFKNLKYTFQNEINLVIEKNKNELEDKLNNIYNKEKSMDDLIIFLLIICLILTILFKFSTGVSDLLIFIFYKIIFKNLLLIIIIIIGIFIYFYKKNFLYNIFNFILIWFKIFTFQWLF